MPVMDIVEMVSRNWIGTATTVVSLREKLRKREKLTNWARELYQRNRAKVDFKRNYTDGEDEVLKY